VSVYDAFSHGLNFWETRQAKRTGDWKMRLETSVLSSWETLSHSLLFLLPFQPTGNRSPLMEIPSRVSDLGVGWYPHLITYLCVIAFAERKLIPVGPAYLAHVRRVVHDLSFEEHDKHVEEEQKRQRNLEQEAGEEDDLGVGDEEENEELLSLDPKEWKVRRKISLLTVMVLCPVLYFLETRQLCCPWTVPS
jgi:hypothetical protein